MCKNVHIGSDEAVFCFEYFFCIYSTTRFRAMCFAAILARDLLFKVHFGFVLAAKFLFFLKI